MCLNLLQSFRVPNSNGEVTGYCSHVFPVGVHCYTRNSPCVGSHNSGVSTGRDVKYSKITLSEASISDNVHHEGIYSISINN